MNRNCDKFNMFAVVLTASSLLYFFYIANFLPPVKRKALEAKRGKLERYVVDTPGCKIPDLDVMNGDVKTLYEILTPINCESQTPLTYTENGQLFINREMTSLYGSEDIQCCYRYIYRVEQNWNSFNKSADNQIRYGECIIFHSAVNLTEDFVKVECRDAGTLVYENMHVLISRPHHPVPVPRQKDQPSILIMGIDSLSRLNFRRQMPLTQGFLEQLGFIEYFGYNKVGDNTFPNLVAVLCGQTPLELREVCWKEKMYPMDNCSFLWKGFRAQNYTTFFAEDMPSWGTFSIDKLGFLAQPTDFYYRPYALAVQELAILETDMCYGYQFGMQHMLDYTREFALTHKNAPFFALSWGVRLTHDDLNEGQHADPLYYRLLDTLYNNEVFKSSVVIVLSDHGMRFGEFRTTYSGYIEERLPTLWVKFPEWFDRQYPEAVATFRMNAFRLTTPFDLHETLLDLLNTSRLSDRSALNKEGRPRGQSLFKEVSLLRNCDQAGIPENWCTCFRQDAILVSEPVIQSAALYVVHVLNQHLESRKECDMLSLSRILAARLTAGNRWDGLVHFKQQYVIRFQTIPAEAQLEAMVEYDTNENEFALMGTVSRLDSYGNQSYCVGDPLLKLYCHCKVPASET